LPQMSLPTEPIIGVLLAGGLSRRMGGGDKCLRRLGGVTLLDHAVMRLRPQTTALVLNANGDPDRFAGFGVAIIGDTVPGFAGPLAGVLAGMLWTRQTHPHARLIATVACDTPFFPTNMVVGLHDAVRRNRSPLAVAASAEREHPTFGLWPVALAEALEASLAAGRRKLLDWVYERNGSIVRFPPATMGGTKIDPFFNINAPDDLALAERLFLAAGNGSCARQEG
jgi:molybdenum cofactor guanylyltransferase